MRVTVVALVLACLAAWALSRWTAPAAVAPPPHEPIDAESRAQLEQVLRDSKEQEMPPEAGAPSSP